MAIACLSACGAGASAPGSSSSPAPTAVVGPTAPPCRQPASPSNHPPVGAAQALTVMVVLVSAGVAATPGRLQLGTTSCVSVGVGQEVSIAVDARIPPVPVEAGQAHLLSAVRVSPPVPATSAVPLAGHYTLTFTAETPGRTSIAYLPVACKLPPGAC